MSNNERRDKLKKFKITYFVGDYFSSKGEEQKTTTILARSEKDAENIFKSVYHDCHLGWIDTI